MLSLIIFIPILAALAIMVGAPARKTAFGAAIAQFALTLLAFLSYNKTARGFQVTSLSPEFRGLARNALRPCSGKSPPFLSLFLGLGLPTPLFPCPSWAPPACAPAPTPTSMLHRGVLKKSGRYGLIRAALPLLPEGAK